MRAIAGTLVLGKAAPGICRRRAQADRAGALAEKLVWGREAALAAGGRPTEPFVSFCGQLEIGWVILEACDPQATGRASIAATTAGQSCLIPPVPGGQRRLGTSAPGRCIVFPISRLPARA